MGAGWKDGRRMGGMKMGRRGAGWNVGGEGGMDRGRGDGQDRR